MEQNIATSKGCCPSVDRSDNGEEVPESNLTGEGDVLSAKDPVEPVACVRGTEVRLACVGVKIQEWGSCLFVVKEEATTIPGWEENSQPQEVLVEDVIQSKVMDQMVSSVEERSPVAAHSVNIVRLANKEL